MKNKSRKLFLLYVVLILATVGTFAPPIIVWIFGVFGKNVPQFSILGSTEWVSMVSLILTTYFGSNVWEKKVALSNGIYPNQIDDTVMQIKGSPGAQQVNVQVDVNNQQPDAELEELRDALRHGR